jgi:hypothetical protein
MFTCITIITIITPATVRIDITSIAIITIKAIIIAFLLQIQVAKIISNHFIKIFHIRKIYFKQILFLVTIANITVNSITTKITRIIIASAIAVTIADTIVTRTRKAIIIA